MFNFAHTFLTPLKKLDFKTKWKIATVIGASMAVVGFAIQFIGLRGLAYPCSVAHFMAIILMAAVRGMIRRRLGYLPDHTHAASNYELDFLAADIVFRSQACYDTSPFMQRNREPEQRHNFISQWEIASIRPKKRMKLFARGLAWDTSDNGR